MLDELAGLAQADDNKEIQDLLNRLKDRGQENGHAV